MVCLILVIFKYTYKFHFNEVLMLADNKYLHIGQENLTFLRVLM